MSSHRCPARMYALTEYEGEKSCVFCGSMPLESLLPGIDRYAQYREWCEEHGAPHTIAGFCQWMPMQARIDELEKQLKELQ